MIFREGKVSSTLEILLENKFEEETSRGAVKQFCEYKLQFYYSFRFGDIILWHIELLLKWTKYRKVTKGQLSGTMVIKSTVSCIDLLRTAENHRT